MAGYLTEVIKEMALRFKYDENVVIHDQFGDIVYEGICNVRQTGYGVERGKGIVYPFESQSDFTSILVFLGRNNVWFGKLILN